MFAAPITATRPRPRIISPGQRAAERGAREVYLHVNRHNARAIRAYERAGFVVAGAVVGDTGGGFVPDDYVMRLRLAA